MARPSKFATPKQLEVWLFVVRYVEKHGYQPTQQEIADELHIDRRAVNERLQALDQKGYIRLPGTGQERRIYLHRIQFKAFYVEGPLQPPATAL